MSWNIEPEWEDLPGALAEESACFAAIGIRVNDHWLTEGHDRLSNSLRTKPYLSAYHLAEWFAWNWWRLRWEPSRSFAKEWGQSHRLSSIGAGYIWPDVTIFSDGERVMFHCEPTSERPETPFRYISDYKGDIAADAFEVGLDKFFESVLDQLKDKKIVGTNFHAIFGSLCEERGAPEQARRRKLEAQLGVDPDEGDAALLDQLLDDENEVGADAIGEIAAYNGGAGEAVTLDQLKEIAQEQGCEVSLNDAVRLDGQPDFYPSGNVPAWTIGAKAAALLRRQEKLNGGKIPNKMLAALAGAPEGILDRQREPIAKFGFALRDGDKARGRFVLHAKRPEGRRFELARLLGDRLLSPPLNALSAATGTYTYRQKMQRTFAAEFLVPFGELEGMMGGDYYSAEKQSDAAEYFDVSEWTIRTLLVNHRKIARGELYGDFDASPYGGQAAE